MRERHVPGPLVVTAQDPTPALDSLSRAMPLVREVVGLSSSTATVLANLLRSQSEYLTRVLFGPDASLGLSPADPGSRWPIATVQDLASGAHLSRSSLYRMVTELRPIIEECAVALVTLLGARGDFARTVWRICELDSPVGRDASGPGVVGGRQRLFGVSLAGGDVDVPAIVRPPADEMATEDVLRELDEMLETVSRVRDRLRIYAAATRPELTNLGIDRSTLTDHAPKSVLLMPGITVGGFTPVMTSGRRGHPWRWSPVFGGANFTRAARLRGFDHAVAETDESPSSGWSQIRPDVLRRLSGLGVLVDLDIALQPSSVSYWVRQDDLAGEGNLHRRQHATGDDSQAVAGAMNFSVLGLRLDTAKDLAVAISYAEFLAQGKSLRFAQQFGDQLAPSFVKAQSEDVRAVFRGLRIMLNAALISAVRRRQAKALDELSI